VVEAGREIGRREAADEADGEDARHVAEDRERHRAREEEPAPQPRRLVEVGVARRQRHQRKDGAQPAARLGDVDGERAVRRREHRARAHHVRAEAVERRARDRGGQEPQVHGDDVEEGVERKAEEEEERGEEDRLRRPPPEERPRNRNEEPDERDDLEAHLCAARAEEAQEEERQRKGERAPPGPADGGAHLRALGPEDVEREERHVPGVGHVLFNRIEHAGRMGQQERLEPPEEPQERRRQHPDAHKLGLELHG